MKHLIKQVQSIVVPKSKYPTEAEAIKYVQGLNLDAHFKLHPDSKSQTWRFRQHIPFDKAEYFTKPIHGGGKLVVDYSHHTPQEYAREIKHQHHTNIITSHLPMEKHQQYSGGGGLHYHDTHNVGKFVHEKEAHVPNIIDMGSFKIDLNAPKRHVPNQVMKDFYSNKQMPSASMPGQNGGGIQRQMPQQMPSAGIGSAGIKQSAGIDKSGLLRK